MIKLNENYEVEVDQRILKSGYIKHWPADTSTKNTPNSQIYIKKPGNFFSNKFFS